DDLRGEHPHALQALMDSGFTDTEMASGFSLRVTGLQIVAQVVIRDFDGCHGLPLSKVDFSPPSLRLQSGLQIFRWGNRRRWQRSGEASPAECVVPANVQYSATTTPVNDKRV